VYDVDSEDAVDMIVMEFVEGRTLDELIPAKGMRPALVVKYGIQIAAALARAHAAGIIHRDLKPSNLIVTPEGRVKILDFGLAKHVGRTEASADDAARSVRQLTDERTIVGTVAYMSPEQAEGPNLDSRSDIFSFGTILYEMFAGRRPFVGNSELSTIAKIVSENPAPLGQLSTELSPDLAKIVARCLRKDPARRFQHIGDVKVALEDVQEESETGEQRLRVRNPRRTRVALLALVALATLGYAIWRLVPSAGAPEPLRIVQLTTLPGTEKYPTFAPDGEQVAYTWSGPNQDDDDVYVQRIGSEQHLRLTSDPSTDFSPAWSPDGLWIAFLRGPVPGTSELRLVWPLGGPERQIAEIHIRQSYVQPPFLSWLPDSRALVAVDSLRPGEPESLYIVSIDSGEKRRLTASPTTGFGDTAPAVSPDGRSVVFERGAQLHLVALKADLTPAGEPVALTETGFGGQQPAWSRDGQEVFFSARSRLSAVERLEAECPYATSLRRRRRLSAGAFRTAQPARATCLHAGLGWPEHLAAAVIGATTANCATRPDALVDKGRRQPAVFTRWNTRGVPVESIGHRSGVDRGCGRVEREAAHDGRRGVAVRRGERNAALVT
jgi:serine/threonine protein kinase